MREIRFRGKRVDTGEWVYGHYVFAGVYGDDPAHRIIWQDGEGTSHSVIVDPETVSECSGLKDKNGKEIYEGDIVELTLDVDRGGAEDRYYNIEKAAVVWNSQDACWDAGDSGLATYVDDENWEHSSKVIGDIYENPELLKGSNSA